MSVGETNDALWYFDSATFAHMTPSEGNLMHKSVYNGSDHALVRNGSLLKIANIGYAQLPTSSRPLHLKSIFHVPQLCHHLLSVKRLCKDNNCSVVVKDKASAQILLQASSRGNVYPLSPWSKSSPPQAFVAFRHFGDIWHRRLGHNDTHILDSLRKNNSISLSNSFCNNCVSCCLGKSYHLSFKLVEYCSSFPLDIIHADVWQSPVISNLGFKYYVIFVDDFS